MALAPVTALRWARPPSRSPRVRRSGRGPAPFQSGAARPRIRRVVALRIDRAGADATDRGWIV